MLLPEAEEDHWPCAAMCHLFWDILRYPPTTSSIKFTEVSDPSKHVFLSYLLKNLGISHGGYLLLIVPQRHIIRVMDSWGVLVISTWSRCSRSLN